MVSVGGGGVLWLVVVVVVRVVRVVKVVQLDKSQRHSRGSQAGAVGQWGIDRGGMIVFFLGPGKEGQLACFCSVLSSGLGGGRVRRVDECGKAARFRKMN